MAQLTDDCFAGGGPLMRVEAALALIAEVAQQVTESEAVPLIAALGRVLNRDLVSEIDVPGQDNSAVDGYAVHFDDLDPEQETRLKVVERAAAGHPFDGTPERGTAVRSTFCDLVITGLVGLRPRADDVIEINPLIPENKWDWFCLDNILYHGKILTILWDKDGTKYNRGKGMSVWLNGKKIGSSATLSKLKIEPDGNW